MNQKIMMDNGVSFQLNLNELTAEICHSPNARGNIFIPKKISYQSQEYTVTSIQEGSFTNNYMIQSIKFSDDSSLISIKKRSFDNSSIKSIDIPSSVEYIEEGWCKLACELKTVTISPHNKNFKYLDEKHQIIVGKSDKKSDIFDVIIFANKKVKKVTIPSHITRISSYSFSNCDKLQKVEISEDSKLQSIGTSAFYDTPIKKIYIPSNVEEIEEGWCKLAYKLKTVTISPQNRNFKYLDEKHQIIVGKSDKKSDIFDVIIFAHHDIENLTIPSYIKRIASYSFQYCKFLQKVEISDDSQLHSIGTGAFFLSNINNIYIPPSLETLEEGWCKKTEELNEVSVSPKNRNYKKLPCEHIVLGKSDTKTDTFDSIVFADRGIRKVSIPISIKHISSYAFESCHKLKEIEFDSQSRLQTIGRLAFSQSSIYTITIPSSVEIIGNSAFSNCQELETVNFEWSSKLKSISKDLFNSCNSLKVIDIPMNSELKEICDNAFIFCAVESLNIPASVEILENDWCDYTEYLTKVTLSPDNENFRYLDENEETIVGKSDKNSDVFDVIVFGNRDIEKVEVPNSIKYIKSSAFDHCSSLKEIIIDDDSELLFFGNESLNSTSINYIYIPSKVDFLGDGWIGYTENLTNVKVSSKNKNFKHCEEDPKIIIGKSDTNSNNFDMIAFSSHDIQKVTIPSYINYISSNSFQCCKQLITVDFQENPNLKIIGEFAFSRSGIESITIPKCIEKICNEAFSNCEKLKKFEIEEGSKLKSFSYGLLKSCKNLLKIQIPDDSKIRSIKQNAFEFCNLNEIYISSNVEELYNDWILIGKSLNIKISPKNTNLKFLDDDHKILLGKSDIDEDNFDTIVFIDKSVKYISTPENVTTINVYFSSYFGPNIECFEFCGKELVDDDIFFLQCTALRVISFPNLHKINLKKIESRCGISYTLFCEPFSIF